MDLAMLVDELVRDPSGALWSGLRVLHFVGLALGLGAATLLDLVAVRFFVRERVSPDGLAIFEFAAARIGDGLLLLWLSGMGMLVWLSAFDPGRLANEKLWAKLAIVAILTMNGAFIHAIVLPRLKRQVGVALFTGMTAAERRALVASGAVSLVSWYAPLVLACLPQLNFTANLATILAAWAIALALAFAAGAFVLSSAGRTGFAGTATLERLDFALNRAGTGARRR